MCSISTQYPHSTPDSGKCLRRQVQRSRRVVPRGAMRASIHDERENGFSMIRTTLHGAYYVTLRGSLNPPVAHERTNSSGVPLFDRPYRLPRPTPYPRSRAGEYGFIFFIFYLMCIQEVIVACFKSGFSGTHAFFRQNVGFSLPNAFHIRIPGNRMMRPPIATVHGNIMRRESGIRDRGSGAFHIMAGPHP